MSAETTEKSTPPIEWRLWRDALAGARRLLEQALTGERPDLQQAAPCWHGWMYICSRCYGCYVCHHVRADTLAEWRCVDGKTRPVVNEADGGASLEAERRQSRRHHAWLRRHEAHDDGDPGRIRIVARRRGGLHRHGCADT